MARTIWSGSLSFGLVNVPVASIRPPRQDHPLQPVEAGTSDRIRYKKVNERTGAEVAQGDIVKGFNVGDGDYVILSDDELTAAIPSAPAASGSRTSSTSTRSTRLLPLGLLPRTPGRGARKAFALLRQVLADANKVRGHARHAQQEYLVTIRPDAGPWSPDHVLLR